MRKNIKGQSFIFYPDATIYWENQKTTLLSDPHFGKVTHFRRNGIPVPSSMIQNNYKVLEAAIHRDEPEKVLILGDLFHSEANHEWQFFKQFMETFAYITFELVKGNHDILPDALWENSRLLVYSNTLRRDPFLFSHEPTEENFDEMVLCGHIHPKVRLRGVGKQSVSLRCFYLKNNAIILPSFGDFTGGYIISPKKGESVIAIAKDELVFFE